MIDKKLDKLGKYAEEILNEEPSNLIDRYFKQNELKNLRDNKSDFEKNFENEIIKSIDNYKNEGLPDNLISYHIYNILVDFIRKSMVEMKACELEIDDTLYKNQMRFLFKGKFK
jgi:hypothetical protein